MVIVGSPFWKINGNESQFYAVVCPGTESIVEVYKYGALFRSVGLYSVYNV